MQSLEFSRVIILPFVKYKQDKSSRTIPESSTMKFILTRATFQTDKKIWVNHKSHSLLLNVKFLPLPASMPKQWWKIRNLILVELFVTYTYELCDLFLEKKTSSKNVMIYLISPYPFQSKQPSCCIRNKAPSTLPTWHKETCNGCYFMWNLNCHVRISSN